MVLASVREPHSGVYILQDVCVCPDKIDVTLLRKAWNQIASRHVALRTSVVVNAARQIFSNIEVAPEYIFHELEWSQSAPEENKSQLAKLLENDRRDGFEFKFGVPLRFTLIRTALGSHTLVLTAHHALLDGRSLLAVWKEWFGTYEALAEGRGPALLDVAPPVELPGEPAERAERFWQTYLAGLESTTGFVTDRLKPAAPPVSRRYVQYGCFLEVSATSQLRELARANGVGLATLVNAAWAILLSRYSGRRDVVFGVTLSGRGASQNEAVGLFINTLPVRIQVDPGAMLSTWLGQIRRDALALREHQATGVEDAIKWSGLPAGTAPFDSVVVYDHEPPQEALRRLGANWSQRKLRRFQGTDLSLVLGSYGEPVLSLNIGYDTNLYCEDTVVAMMGHLRTILASMCSHPNGQLSDIGMLTDSEKESFLAPHTVDIDSSFCIHELFESQVRRTPAHAALEADDEVITYDELNRRANRLASLLRKRGVGLEDLVAVNLSSVRDTIVAVLGILKAGGAFLPVDPAAPEERRAAILADARPKFTVDEQTDRAELLEQPDGDMPPSAEARNAAYAIFTSGSTGKPKAIVVSHRALVNHTLAVVPVYGITPSDRRLQFASLASDVFVAEVFNYLTAGATIVICPEARRSSLQEFHRVLAEQRITITAVPGSWWNVWVSGLSAGSVHLPPSLRAVVVGMERADPAAFHEWRQASGHRLRWFNAYGPAENSPTSTIYEAKTSRWECSELLPIGKPIANTTAYVLGREGELLPPGVAGELYVGGAGIARGYLAAPELTAMRFVDDPFREGSRLYRTGDRAFALPDGNLVFAGRLDRQVKVRGYRVELDEIEEALARHPAVKQCAVVATDDSDRQRLGAYVVGGASKHELHLHLARLLPEYMIPAVWMKLDRLPLTPSGKIDRRALPPCESSAQVASMDFPPSTPSELLLATLWREALGVQEVNLLDDFFLLGGDSLSATVLLLRIQEEFNVQLSLAALFQTSTLARLAAKLDAGEESDGSSMVFHEGGAGAPFFFVPYLGGSASVYAHIADRIAPYHPSYGFSPRLSSAAGSGLSIESTAMEYVAEVNRVVPSGQRVVIVGYSSGGLVAFEVARQLRRSARHDPLLVVLDTPLTNAPGAAPSGFWRQVVDALRNLPVWAAHEAAHLQPRKFLLGVQGHLARIGRSVRGRPAAQEVDPRIYAGRASVHPAYQALLNRMYRAMLTYSPGPYEGKVVLLRAKVPTLFRTRDTRMGWDLVAVLGVELHQVPGRHDDCLSDVYGAELARVLVRCVERNR
jgi:amino acid adenylation domain-containing protein